MAWRIADYVAHGELDNRIPGQVTGKVWLRGKEKPLELDLQGNPHRDLAGHWLKFRNPNPKTWPEDMSGMASSQSGKTGDLTAARKCKILECSLEEAMHLRKSGKDFPYHWGNTLYLEWFSVYNGRVVIEAHDFELETSAEAAWKMTPEMETQQFQANQDALVGFMDIMLEGLDPEHLEIGSPVPEEDGPQSVAEAEADEEDARMQLLMDRIEARLEEEGNTAENFERVMEEERERLRKERGEPDPEWELDPWAGERDAMLEEAMDNLDGLEDMEIPGTHPLTQECQDLGLRIHHDCKDNGWIPEGASSEHPLNELSSGATAASAKLAGALHRAVPPYNDWPPKPLFAGDSLVRLKKARGFLNNAWRGLEGAQEDGLANPEWLESIRKSLHKILLLTEALVEEVREVLKDGA